MKHLFLSLCLLSAYGATTHTWTWLYIKDFNAEVPHRDHKDEKKTISFSKENTPHFNQVICSFNAHRPSRGFFRFIVQVRDAQTKKWYKKHTMYEWGASVQRSYKSDKSNELNGTSYHHVRLELPRSRYGDAMRIVVESHNGASLCKLAGLYVNIVNLHAYTSKPKEEYSLIPSVYLDGLCPLSQLCLAHAKKEVLCSPTSARMVIDYVNRLLSTTDLLSAYCHTTESFADAVYDPSLDTYGNWIFNCAEMFMCMHGRVQVYVRRLPTFAALCSQLRKGIPVVVSVRGYLEGAPKVYANGHLLVVVGWDAHTQEVLCCDPAFDNPHKVSVRYAIKSFMHAWGTSRHLAYCVNKIE